MSRYSTTTTAMLATREKGTSRCGSRVSPAEMMATSNPVYAKTSSRAAWENAEYDGGVENAYRSGRTKNSPAAVNRIRGISFPAVKKLLTRAVIRTPATFASVSAEVTTRIISGRHGGCAADGTK